MRSLKERVITWAESGGDLVSGISLFLSYNSNILYARNIEVKGIDRGTKTLLSEFSRKIKMNERELREMVDRSRREAYTNVLMLEYDSTVLHELDDATHGEPARQIEINELPERDHKKKVFKLRDEFPFLGSADCPDILAVLVNKMLTSHDAYRRNREKLFEVDFNDSSACYDTARSVLDPYIQNREIWEELNYYKIHGKLLGNTAEFTAMNLRKKLEELSTVKLATELRSNIPRRMSYMKKQFGNENSDKLAIRQKMDDIELEKQMIREILMGRGELE
jgi:hypothetical protein